MQDVSELPTNLGQFDSDRLQSGQIGRNWKHTKKNEMCMFSLEKVTPGW